MYDYSNIPIFNEYQKKIYFAEAFTSKQSIAVTILAEEFEQSTGISYVWSLSSSPKGIKILISYLDDNRRILNEFAHITLIKTTGRKFEKDPITWNKWLDNNINTFTSIPITERAEG